MRMINEVIIHCTDTPAKWREGQPTSRKVAEVKRWHVEDNGWSDIGYHYLIDRDGTVAKGRPIERAGAHTKGRNKHSIGVALFGGKGGTASDAFSDNFTAAQEHALLTLLNKLYDTFGTLQVSGHNQYAQKACPTFNVPFWYSHETPKVARTSVEKTSTFKAARIIDMATVATPVVGAVAGIDWPKLLIIGVFSCVILGSAYYIKSERGKKFMRGDT